MRKVEEQEMNETKMSKQTRTRALVEGAVMVALSAVLSFIKIEFAWLQGGSVELSMIPIVLYAVRWGCGWGLGAGLALGVLQWMFGGFAANWQSIILDYAGAYMLLGLAGLFKGKKQGIIWGSLLGGFGRFVVHYISGVTIYAEYMPETFFGMTMTTPYFSSLLYNGSYMAVNILLSIVVCFALTRAKPIAEYVAGSKK